MVRGLLRLLILDNTTIIVRKVYMLRSLTCVGYVSGNWYYFITGQYWHDRCDWLSYSISYFLQKRIIACAMEMELNSMIILVFLWQVGHDTEKCYLWEKTYLSLWNLQLIDLYSKLIIWYFWLFILTRKTRNVWSRNTPFNSIEYVGWCFNYQINLFLSRLIQKFCKHTI